MWQEFKKFAIRGNMIDLAVGLTVGAAFGGIVSSFVADVIMPPIGLLLGRVNFANLYLLLKAGQAPPPYESLAAAKAAGAVTVNYGAFITTVVNFLIVAFFIFLLVRSVNRLYSRVGALKPKESIPTEPAKRECPYCLSLIPARARKCAYCTADLPGMTGMGGSLSR